MNELDNTRTDSGNGAYAIHTGKLNLWGVQITP